MITILPYSDYYFKALDSIPKEHTHRDEIISLLIDQVIDDSYGYSTTDCGTGSTGTGSD
jgi:hypothetical protein